MISDRVVVTTCKPPTSISIVLKWGKCNCVSLHPKKGHCPKHGLCAGRADCKQHLSPWNTFCGYFLVYQRFHRGWHKPYSLEIFYENNFSLVEQWQGLQMFLPMTGIVHALAALRSKIRHWNIWNVQSLQIGSSQEVLVGSLLLRAIGKDLMHLRNLSWA